jgi:hypothetical protein
MEWKRKETFFILFLSDFFPCFFEQKSVFNRLLSTGLSDVLSQDLTHTPLFYIVLLISYSFFFHDDEGGVPEAYNLSAAPLIFQKLYLRSATVTE